MLNLHCELVVQYTAKAEVNCVGVSHAHQREVLPAGLLDASADQGLDVAHFVSRNARCVLLGHLWVLVLSALLAHVHMDLSLALLVQVLLVLHGNLVFLMHIVDPRLDSFLCVHDLWCVDLDVLVNILVIFGLRIQDSTQLTSYPLTNRQLRSWPDILGIHTKVIDVEGAAVAAPSQSANKVLLSFGDEVDKWRVHLDEHMSGDALDSCGLQHLSTAVSQLEEVFWGELVDA